MEVKLTYVLTNKSFRFIEYNSNDYIIDFGELSTVSFEYTKNENENKKYKISITFFYFLNKKEDKDYNEEIKKLHRTIYKNLNDIHNKNGDLTPNYTTIKYENISYEIDYDVSL